MAIDLQTARSAIEVATHLKQQFATRAAHHDRTGIFAQENIDDLRQAGLLSLRISTPERLPPFTLGVLQDIIGQIAQGDASTALIMVNHYMVRAAIAHRKFGSDEISRWIEDEQHDQLLNILLADPGLRYTSRGGSAHKPLERTHRDALCGRIHAPHAELLRCIAGQQALS